MTNTARSVKEWFGKTPDSDPPDYVKVRIFLRHNGVCPKCTRKLIRGQWQCDHIIALVNGGENRERNLQPLCTSPCHSQKTKADVAEKSRVDRKRKADILSARSRSKLQGRSFIKPPPQRRASTPPNKWRGYE